MDTPSRPGSPLENDDRPAPIVSRESTREPVMIEASLSIDAIRQAIVDLTASERLEKESALHVTRLFHAMEMLMRHECTERDRRIAAGAAELERVRLAAELDRGLQTERSRAMRPRRSPDAPRKSGKKKIYATPCYKMMTLSAVSILGSFAVWTAYVRARGQIRRDPVPPERSRSNRISPDDTDVVRAALAGGPGAHPTERHVPGGARVRDSQHCVDVRSGS